MNIPCFIILASVLYMYICILLHIFSSLQAAIKPKIEFSITSIRGYTEATFLLHYTSSWPQPRYN